MANQNTNKTNTPLIGILAVKNSLITKKELQTGLEKCSKEKNLEDALKEYFLAQELISAKNIDRLVLASKALSMRQKELQFGVIAIKKGFINKSLLKLALEEQQDCIKNKQKPKRIGDMLVDAGMLSEKQRDSILSLQKRDLRKAENEEGDVAEQLNGKKEEEAPADVEENEPEGPRMLEPEVISGGVKLQVSSDYMAAYLSKTDHFKDTISVFEIKESLFEKNIVVGLADDKLIKGFIQSSGFKTKTFRVAKGVKPIQGKDAKIEFFFNTDYLTAGDVTEEGSIDFKERGEVPFIEAGTVLAEKTPIIESKNGRSIFGDEIETTPGVDIPLKFSKGAKLSEDGLKILADVGGYPKFTMSGVVFVHEEYTTSGDVDYETGHIDFDGNINVKGRICSGFKVKGNDIRTIELDGGIIKAQGDLRVAGGINEGKIYARGNVYAKYVHKSEISCMGDVIVVKEIVDSKIQNSGKCNIENGKIISSKIISKMGVLARNVGTETADPCLLKVGHDAFSEKELKLNKLKTDELKKEILEIEKKRAGFDADNTGLQKKITELAHVQDRAQLEHKEISSKMAALETEDPSTGALDKLQQEMEELKEKAKNAEEDLDRCFADGEVIEDKLEQGKKDLENIKEKIEELANERENVIKWSKENPGNPVVAVSGALMAETVVKGNHCEKRFLEVVRHSKIVESLMRSDQGQGMNIYEMQVRNF